MGFVVDVQEWLRRGPAPERPPLPEGFDLEGRREAFWRAMEQVDAEHLREVHGRWSRSGLFEAFVSEIIFELRRGIGARWEPDRLERMVDVAIDSEVRFVVIPPTAVGGAAIAIELERIGTVARARAERKRSLGDHYIAELEQWCKSVRICATDGSLTQLGHVLLDLVGRDAVHFVLELEVAQSSGVGDDKRLSRSILAELLTEAGLTRKPNPLSFLPVDRVDRLEDLGVVSVEEVYGDSQPGLVRYKPHPDAIDLLRTVIDPAPNPMRALVHALLDAERGKVITSSTSLPTNAGTDFAYVRMVVHELRNMTLPLSVALDRLWPELARPEGPDRALLADLQQRVERSMARIEEFTQKSAYLATVATPEAFVLGDVIAEAIEASAADRNGRIAVELESVADAEIEGSRGRWVLLFVNLLRNSAQMRRGKGTVWIHTAWTPDDELHILVDDDGPGVPPELHERIFAMGVSTRGGTGSGLADARATATLSRGTLVYEDSPRGGARFRVRVTARRRS